MRGWLAALRTELRHGIAPWVLPLVALTIVALLWLDHSSDWGGRWNSLGRFMRELLIVLGPVCVTFGTWQGGRARRAGVGELLGSTQRTVLERQSVEIAALSAAISAGVLLGWASAAWTIVLVGGWGTSAAAWYLFGLFPAVLAYTTAGYAVGCLAPWRIAAPLAGAATYVGVGFFLWNSDIVAIPMGAGWLGGTYGYPFDLDALWLSMAVLLLAALALWGVASVERRPGVSRQWLSLFVAGTLGVVVLAPLSMAAANISSTDLATDPDTPLACTPDKPEVCVLAEDRLLLPQTVARARPILERLAGIPGAPTRARPTGNTPDANVLGVTPGDTTPWGKSPTDDFSSTIDIEIMFGPQAYCPTGRYGQPPRPVRQAFQRPTGLVTTWLDPEASYAGLESPGIEGFLKQDSSPRARDLTERFLASTEKQRTDYAAAVLAASKSCDIPAVRTATDSLAPAQ